MIAATTHMAFAAIAAELAHRARRAGNEARHRSCGGWAVIFAVTGILCALMTWIFG